MSVRLSHTLLSLCLVFGLAPRALGATGVVELSQACAESGCTPTDFAGFPINLSQPGSYRLTSNLQVENPDLDAIAISVHGVVIDLGGFQISGPCTPPANCGGVTAGGNGVIGLSDSTVRNGTIVNFKGNGINLIETAHIEDLIIERNQRGVQIYSGHIQRSLIQKNTGLGIAIVTGGIVEHNMILRNGGTGVFLDNSTPPVGELIVRSNLIQKNGGHGIETQRGAKIIGNSISDNSLKGIRSPITVTLNVGSLISVERNAVYRNQTGGIDLGANAQLVDNATCSNQGDGIKAGAGSRVEGNFSDLNTGRGISVGDGSAVLECLVRASGSTGISAGDGCQVRSNLVTRSTLSGISTGAGAEIADNVSNDNQVDGITVGGAGRAFGNVTVNNDRFGLGLNASVGYAENNSNGNGTAETFSGVSMGTNVCGGNVTCP